MDPKKSKVRFRAEAGTGKGDGAKRKLLFEYAREHIERSMDQGFHCEAIAIIESVISDRLESRLSYLKKKNIGFRTLGELVRDLGKIEHDSAVLACLKEVDSWRKLRNSALHELVKIEAGAAFDPWEARMLKLSQNSSEGYTILKRLYHLVADLNPWHLDRVFAAPPT